jgi:hypothetical protein
MVRKNIGIDFGNSICRADIQCEGDPSPQHISFGGEDFLRSTVYLIKSSDAAGRQFFMLELTPDSIPNQPMEGFAVGDVKKFIGKTELEGACLRACVLACLRACVFFIIILLVQASRFYHQA